MSSPGRQRGLQPLFGLRQSARRFHLFGDLHHDGDDAAGLAAFVNHRRIVEIEPAGFHLPAPVQHQLLLAVRQRAAGHADLHHIVVPVGHFGPAFAHLRAQQAGMARARELRIGVVVDHDAVGAPQQHQRHGGMQHQPDGGFQADRPGRDRPQRAGPVMARDPQGHVAAARKEWFGDARPGRNHEKPLAPG